MNWDWETIKEHLKLVHAKLAKLLLFLTLCHYLLACVVASKPVTPKAYVDFMHHVFQWPGPQMEQASIRADGAKPAPGRGR